MSIEIMTDVWKYAPCLENDLLVLLALADSANDERECWPSLRTIAKKTRITLKECLLIVQNLNLQGFIEIEHRKDARRNNLSNKYHIQKVEDWLLLSVYNLLNPIVQERQEGGVSKAPSTGNRVFQGEGGLETGVFHSEGESETESSYEPKLEKRESRKRSTPATPSIHPLIQAWANVRGIDMVNIGAPIHTTKDTACAKRMAKWELPPTDDEIKAVVSASKSTVYRFQWLEGDIAAARLAKQPAKVNEPKRDKDGLTAYDRARLQHMEVTGEQC